MRAAVLKWSSLFLFLRAPRASRSRPYFSEAGRRCCPLRVLLRCLPPSNRNARHPQAADSADSSTASRKRQAASAASSKRKRRVCADLENCCGVGLVGRALFYYFIIKKLASCALPLAPSPLALSLSSLLQALGFFWLLASGAVCAC